jgi:hypothetical protein
VFAIKLQAEATTIAQAQEERILVGRFLTSMLDAIAHGILQAMAALHQERSLPLPPPKRSLPLPPPKGGGIKFESGWFLDTIEVSSKVVGDVVEVRVFRGER